MASTVEPKRVNVKRRTDPTSDPNIVFYAIVGTMMAVVGIGIIVLAYINISDMTKRAEEKFDKNPPPSAPVFKNWNPVATQNRRFKPFETCAKDAMRFIHGRDRLLGQDAAAVVLMWMFELDRQQNKENSKWHNIPFILCENRQLRKAIWTLEENGKINKDQKLTRVQEYGKYVSPADLEAFKKNLEFLREVDNRAAQSYSHILGEIRETFARLARYQNIRRQTIPQDKRGEYQIDEHSPFASLVALDKVKGTPWFSIDEMRLIERKPDMWFDILDRRVRKSPHLYLNDTHKKALKEFQQRVAKGEGLQAVGELVEPLRENRDGTIIEYKKLRNQKKDAEAAEIFLYVIRTWPIQQSREEANQQIVKLIPPLQQISYEKFFLVDKKTRVEFLKASQGKIAADAKVLENVLAKRDEANVANLEGQIPDHRAYFSFHPKWHMLHMSFLEVRFPNLYEEVARWQQPPLDDIKNVLAQYEKAGEAYRSKDSEKFEKATEEFLATVEKISKNNVGVYPGAETYTERIGHLLAGTNVGPPSRQLLDLEMNFNRVRPFMWAWITMLAALILFTLSLALNSRICYFGAYAVFAVSMCFQVFGFFTRMMISGRPPVTNMYETVIWVAFMSSIFALILEMIYRRKVIAVAGSLVATLGLVLADKMPLALNPSIDPLTPVLRSNFWLTIHVLTIVSSYAAGTLAWGLGNISLVLIVFRQGTRETIKLLSGFTYRAIQIAVILLAIGTFLGGWWAAYSWGRFWGWDAKENGALIALLCYIIPLHMRFIGWLKDFGLAIAAIICYAAILISWYGVNFIWPAGLHSYGFSGGGATWVYMMCLINIEWVLCASLIYWHKLKKQKLEASGAD